MITFDINDSLHVDFIEAASLLYAETYLITGESVVSHCVTYSCRNTLSIHTLTEVKDRAYIAEKAASIKVEPFVPKDIKIHTSDAEAQADNQATTSVFS